MLLKEVLQRLYRHFRNYFLISCILFNHETVTLMNIAMYDLFLQKKKKNMYMSCETSSMIGC